MTTPQQQLAAVRAALDAAARAVAPAPTHIEKDVQDLIGRITAGADAAGIVLGARVPIGMRHAVGISPLRVLTSLLIGAAAGGFIGALLAVPIAASVEIILQRLQARQEPVAQDPSSIETEEDKDEEEASQGATELKKALSD